MYRAVAETEEEEEVEEAGMSYVAARGVDRVGGVRLILIDVERTLDGNKRDVATATRNCCDGGKRLIVAWRRRQETELGENSSRTSANQQLRMTQLKSTWRR